jgi:hypothetical protein
MGRESTRVPGKTEFEAHLPAQFHRLSVEGQGKTKRMKTTKEIGVFATAPCRGLSPSR